MSLQAVRYSVRGDGSLDEAPFELKSEAEIWVKTRESWIPPVEAQRSTARTSSRLPLPILPPPDDTIYAVRLVAD